MIEQLQSDAAPPSAPSPLDIRRRALDALAGDDPRPVHGMVYALVYIGDILTTSVTSALYDLGDQLRDR